LRSPLVEIVERALHAPRASSRVAQIPALVCDLKKVPSNILRAQWTVAAIALAKFALHCTYNNRYGYFRDEFDYLACGDHPAWGYVDHPPLLPMLARVSRIVLGDSLRAVRLLPALASSAAVLLAARIASELGGGPFAMVLTAVAVALAPIYLSDGSLLTTNCPEPLLWMGCVYFAILAIKRDQPRCWLWFGVVAGIGLQEKYSIAVLGIGIVAGLLLTTQRRFLRSPWLWLGGVAALVTFLPNLIWSWQHQWPFFQLMRNIRAEGRDVVLSPGRYFVEQILLIGPVAAPIWIVGAAALLFSPRLRPYRMLGWCYLVCFAIVVALKGKNYYLAPIYPMLLAAGAVTAERLSQTWIKGAILATVLIAGLAFAPIVVPVLSIDSFLTYMQKLPFAVPRSEHSHAAAVLPQHYADQFGWIELEQVAARAWQRIPATDRPGCGIFAQNYGQAGAIDFFGRRDGLPPALSGHQSYWLWGPHGYSGDCLIVVGDRRERLASLFESVEYVGSSDHPYALERHIPVFICRGARFGSLERIWPSLKKWR
jgi:Dolichyl-phosphate-mannose-protein mannosyltransferase